MRTVQPARVLMSYPADRASACADEAQASALSRLPAGLAQPASSTALTRAQAAESAVEELSASFGDITAQAAHDVMQDAPALAPRAIARQTSVLARERWMPEAHGAQHAPPSAGGVVQHLRHPSLQAETETRHEAVGRASSPSPVSGCKRSFDALV